jgi:hypothetical protein
MLHHIVVENGMTKLVSNSPNTTRKNKEGIPVELPSDAFRPHHVSV